MIHQFQGIVNPFHSSTFFADRIIVVKIFESLGGQRKPSWRMRAMGWLDRLDGRWREWLDPGERVPHLMGLLIIMALIWSLRSEIAWHGWIVLILGVALINASRLRRLWTRQGAGADRRGPGRRTDLDLENAISQLFHDKQRLTTQVDDLTAMREVSLAVGSILDFGEMIRAILDLVTTHFGVSRALIYLRGEDEAWLEAVGARSEGSDVPLARILAKRVPVGTGIVGRAASERRDLLEKHSEKGIVVAIPLIAKDRVVGVLKLSDADPAAIDGRRCEKLHGVAGAIAVALENSRLYRMAVTDGLTGLYVHRHFQHRLEEEFTRSQRYRAPLSLLMVDIDHFKRFNDEHGHAVGDFVLRQVARALAEEARATDVACRYGGEEMALICPETELEGARRIAERIRARIALRRYHPEEGGPGLSVTVSIGVAVVAEEMRERGELVVRADEALYRAKRNGRNRVEAADEGKSEETGVA
jgi:diguanylate cyclase (GGDEF)-like protein